MNYRILSLFICSLLTLTGLKAQDDFAELSSRERINLAEKEEKEAAHDAEFQGVMQKGHELFKEKHYLKAIHTYEEAQELRPYNVYPKVIIADIELSMKDTLQTLRAAEKNNLEQTPQKPKVKPEKEKETETPDRDEETKEERIEKINEWEQDVREKRERQRAREAEKEKQRQTADTRMDGDVKRLSAEDFQKELAEKYPRGITETVSKEGNKTIVKRIVVAEGIGNEYKKVVHNWGGVFYFKNGDAVTERVWKQETEK